ncbi:endonuclease/exonuclease/phosphatase family protein [Streptomyces sp. NPDC048241]|uniref:endonuclease/exonuclease/phosphatase family protein n=1 Tax=Streptomyces sp. NPDC048241 TaxID=3365521 RepID=UPI0037182DAD
MRRLMGLLAVFCAALLGLQVLSAPSAGAAEVSQDAEAIAKSAGQKWALKSLANRQYVSVALTQTDEQLQWWMRARAASVGSWERFTLHTNHKAKTIGLRSEVTGFLASAEFHDGGDRQGMLRARGVRLGQWQQFTPQYLAEAPPEGSPGGSVVVALTASEKAQDDPNGTPAEKERKYVSAEVGEGGDGLLRARSASLGSWEKFVLEPVAAAGTGPLPEPAGQTASTLDVMSWNVCANNNDDCGWSDDRAGYAELTEEIRTRLRNPDVIFFQEFCEKHAKRVEWLLEKETPIDWDVRFAPLHHATSGGPLVQKQCAMGPKPDSADRGAFGVAVAVPDENTWYQRHDLTSPAADQHEQRSALCAALPSRAVMVCNAHFTAGGKDFGDPNGSIRTTQAKELRDIARNYERQGYRVIFGGDFNSVPPDFKTEKDGPTTILTDTYAAYRECDEGSIKGSPRDGEVTKPLGNREIKIDYIFAPDAAEFTSCTVTRDTGKSDHYPLYGTVTLPAA